MGKRKRSLWLKNCHSHRGLCYFFFHTLYMGSAHSLSIVILSIKNEERERRKGERRRKEKLKERLLLDYDIKVRVGEEDAMADTEDEEDMADDEDMVEGGEKEMLL